MLGRALNTDSVVFQMGLFRRVTRRLTQGVTMALSFLDRERSVAPAGYSRWLVPPAALAIHLSIGQVYAFSVFKNPLLALHAANGSAWNLKAIGYIFSIAIAFLGISAALFGAWLEKAGPRRAMFYAAVCFGAGFFIASFGAKYSPISPAVSRLRSPRRYRSWSWITSRPSPP